MSYCPCGSGKLYQACCHLYISGKKLAPSAETLMRSRYTAYTKVKMDYIERTMKAPAILRFNKKDSEMWASENQWEKLEIIKSQEKNNSGIVEFIAYYSSQGQKQTLHETSQFSFENGEWFYVDAIPDIIPLPDEF